MASKRYTSVREMVQQTAGPEFAEPFHRHLEERQLVTRFVALRGAKGLAQSDVAQRMNCSQSRVSKLERAKDEELRLGDIVAYAKALDLRLGVILSDKQPTMVDQVKHHTFAIKRLLDRLVDLVKDDTTMAKGAAQFCGETFLNLARMVQAAASKLPPQPEVNEPFIRIEMETNDSCDDVSAQAARVEGGSAENESARHPETVST